MSVNVSRRPVVVPLLNEYKYGLFWRRLFQTFFGGVRIRKVPWLIHVIQVCLWLAPLLLSIPFIIVDSLQLWNPYFIALVYAFISGVFIFLMKGLVMIIRHHLVKGSNGSLNEFDDEEESIDMSLYPGAEAIDFIFLNPKKILGLILHPVISVIFSFFSSFLLLPRVLQQSIPLNITATSENTLVPASNIAGVVVIFIIGWFTVCNAFYSLSTRTPLEIAVYRPTDPLGLKHLYRPFYIILLGSIFIGVRELVAVPYLYLQLLYACLCLMPVGWMIGVLPPLDVLFPWLMEQTLTRLLGGSPMATDIRLLVVYFFSFTSVAVIIPVSDSSIITAHLVLATFGFLLSQDFFTHFKMIIYLLTSQCHNRISRFISFTCKRVVSKTYKSYVGIGDFHTISKFSYFLQLLSTSLRAIILLAASLVGLYFTSDGKIEDTRRELMIRIFSGWLIGLCVLVVVSDSLQRPYLLGVIRNLLHPKLTGSLKQFKWKRKKLHFISVPRRIIVIYISPIVMIVLVGLTLASTNTNTLPSLWKKIATARILRKIWQNTPSALNELAIVSILLLALPSNNPWSLLGLPTQALIAGLSLDIIKDFLQKVTLIVTSMGAFMWYRKQRTKLPLSILIIIGNFLFSPILAAIVLISSVFSAPLLPLFTLPIFTLSFPRTLRFWPSLLECGSVYLKSEATVYYQQAEPAIAKAVHSSISSGSAPSQPGTQLLLRFDNRIVLATILEVYHGSCTIVIRGLELQETSCHSEEATRMDDIFKAIHDPNSPCQFLFNGNIFNTLQPVDSVVIQTYSDARNILTGIIDQPSALERFSSNLIRSLVWVFHQHFRQYDFGSLTPNNDTTAKLSNRRLDMTVSRKEIPQAWSEDHLKPEAEEDRESWLSVSSSTSPQQQVSSEENFMAPPDLLPVDIPLDRELGRRSTSIETRLSFNSPAAVTKSVTNRIYSEDRNFPPKWKLPPFSQIQMKQIMKHFPNEWYAFLNHEQHLDSKKFELFSGLVVGCYSILDTPCRSTFNRYETPQTKPMDIYRGFCGEFPYSEYLSWLTDEPAVRTLALKSYRYAVKLMYDECSLGEVESLAELAEYLEEYDQKWCIVKETEESWEAAVLSNVSHLFSLGQDNNEHSYTAHVLSLQDEIVHIGMLNAAALQGIWADLAFELFYLTNDDEERYSIQAHPLLLRNLSVQMADPPLGYCVHASGPITIPST